MAKRERQGHMYDFVTHSINFIKGRCPHQCDYCFMYRGKQRPQDFRFDEREFRSQLGKGNTIYVGSGIDIFADDIPEDWILRILSKCKRSKNNTFFFQSQNPERIFELRKKLPKNCIVSTTIETNRYYYQMSSSAPRPEERAEHLSKLKEFRRYVAIEPVMDFDMDEMVGLIQKCNPELVMVGADAIGSSLTEPSKEKVLELIAQLEEFTNVYQRESINRILNQ